MSSKWQLKSGILFLAIVVGFFLVMSSCEEDSGTSPTEPVPSIGVNPEQIPTQYDSVEVAGVTSPDQGWLVLRRDNNGSPNMSEHLLDPIQVQAGHTSNTGWALGSTDVADGEMLWITLHRDAGSTGTYEEDDQTDPQYEDENEPVQKSITIHSPMLEVNDQTTGSNNVSVSNVRTGVDGWVVMHRDDGTGSPGPVVGYTSVSEGEHSEVVVALEDTMVYQGGTTLFPMLHIDDGDGEYEFPGDDIPEIFGTEGNVIVASFEVQPPTGEIVHEGADQIISQNAVRVDSIQMSDKGWIVFHEDGPGTIISDTVSVSAGASNNVNIGFAFDQGNPLTDPSSGQTVVLVLHTDNGTIDEFTFGDTDYAGTGFDGPIRDAGAPVVHSITIDRPRVSITEPADASNDTITVDHVTMGVPGWAVVHKASDGSIIGAAMVDAGTTQDVEVSLTESVTSGQNLIVMLHINMEVTEDDALDFPDGNDAPEVFGFDANGDPQIVQTTFSVE